MVFMRGIGAHGPFPALLIHLKPTWLMEVSTGCAGFDPAGMLAVPLACR